MKTSEKTKKSHGIKNSKLEKKRFLFLNIGLFVTLCLVFFAFKYTAETEIKKPIQTGDLIDDGWRPINTFQEPETKKTEKVEIKKEQPVNPFSIEVVSNNTKIENKIEKTQENLDPDEYLVGLDEPEKTETDPLPPIDFAQEMPHFKDCKEIKDNIQRKECTELIIHEILDKYLIVPEDVKAMGESFTAYLSFVVREDGRITNVEVLRSPSKSFNKAVLKAVKYFPAFIPGRQDGRKRAVILRQPIKVTIK